MRTTDFNATITADQLNESMFKKFGSRVEFNKYTREELENYRNLLRTKLTQTETVAGFNELLANEGYQKDKFMLNLLNTRIKEMLGESKKQLSEKAVSKAQQQAAGVALAAKKAGKAPAGKGAAAEMAKMPKKELEKFAGTKHKGLPKKVDEVSATTLKSYRDKADKQSLDIDAYLDSEYARPTRKERDRLGTQMSKRDAGVKLADKKLAQKTNEASKPDFLDLDKDGNKKEPMKKAAKDKKTTEDYDTRGAYEKSDPKHPDFKKNYEKFKAANPDKTLADFVAKMKGSKIKEGSKPDFLDLDKDGNKKEPMKKAAKDKKKVKEGAMKQNYNIIIESLRQFIAEDEEGKAKDITAGTDMVNDFTSWMQRVGQYQTKSMIELSDSIRANFGQAEADAFKNAIQPALAETLSALTQSRETLTRAVATLAGEESAEPMGMGGDELVPDMGTDLAEPAELDSMNEPGDEFGAADAAAGGAEAAGRGLRESRTFKRAQKLAEAHSIMSRLAR